MFKKCAVVQKMLKNQTFIDILYMLQLIKKLYQIKVDFLKLFLIGVIRTNYCAVLIPSLFHRPVNTPDRSVIFLRQPLILPYHARRCRASICCEIRQCRKVHQSIARFKTSAVIKQKRSNRILVTWVASLVLIKGYIYSKFFLVIIV